MDDTMNVTAPSLIADTCYSFPALALNQAAIREIVSMWSH